MKLIFVISCILLISFIILYKKNPYSLINGFIFDIFLATFAMSSLIFMKMHPNKIFKTILFASIIIFSIIILVYILMIVIYLGVNSIKMLKKESRTLANSLSLILTICIVIQFGIGIFFTKYVTNKIVLGIFSLINSIEIYLVLVAMAFITISIIITFDKPRKNIDYLIVLGAGLINGKDVSPLLAGRINSAIDYYNKQKCKIVFSGGKGSDEDISEAEAMREYALSRGVLKEDLIIEDKSKNTLENMKFSKIIIDKRHNDKYNVSFVTSNYHMFRAGFYANKVGLKGKTLGSKTASYYYPNAMIREYIALLVTNKRFNAIAIGFIFFTYIASWILILRLGI